MRAAASWLVVVALIVGACGGDATSAAPVPSSPSSSVAVVESQPDRSAAETSSTTAECPVYTFSDPFPAQPASTSFPTDEWTLGAPTEAADPERLAELLDEALTSDGAPWGRVAAVLVVSAGVLVVEEYGRGLTPDERQPSFSIAKTVLHAAIGIAAEEGLVDPATPVAAREWEDEDDPRRQITIDHLLEMSSGLQWSEGGVDIAVLLAATDRGNAAAAQALKPLIHPPGEVFEYSTGSSAMAARALGDAVGTEELAGWLADRLFEPIGIGGVELQFDAEGYWLGGFGANMTARDFARLGLLYLRGGAWDGEQVVPVDWIRDGRTPAAACDYGSGLRLGRFTSTSYSAEGFLGQNLVMVPDEDLVVLVLGSEPRAELGDELTRQIITAWAG